MTYIGKSVMIPIGSITSKVRVRSVKRSGVERIKESMRKYGFLPQHPLLVIQKADGTYELYDGGHRMDAASELGIAEVPIQVLEEGELTDSDKKRLARLANEATGTLVLTTLVDDAEFVWGEVKLGKKLAEIADMLKWSEAKVKQYSALSAIDTEAWKAIAATLERNERILNDEEASGKVTIVTFTEGLLRSILNLTSAQQNELVSALTSGEIGKGEFKTLAASYRVSNDVRTYVSENPDIVSIASYDGLTPHIIKELEERDASFDEIANVAAWAREFKSDVRYCASKVLHIGSWILGCVEGEGDNDPPYTQEHLENEGWAMWCLVPNDIPSFQKFGKMERTLHDLEVAKGKDFFDVTDEDMLSTLTQDAIKWLADSFIRVMFRSCSTIWHYRTLGMSKEQEEKFLNGEQVDPYEGMEFGDLDAEGERIKWLIEERRAGRGNLPRIAIEIGLRLDRVKAMFDYAEFVEKHSPGLAEHALKRGHFLIDLKKKLTSEEFEQWLISKGTTTPLVEQLTFYAQRYEKDTPIEDIDDDARFEMACAEIDVYFSLKKAS